MNKGYLIDFTNGGGIMPIKFSDGEKSAPSKFYLYGKLSNIKNLTDTIAYTCPNCKLIQQYLEGPSLDLKSINVYGIKMITYMILGSIAFILLVSFVAYLLNI